MLFNLKAHFYGRAARLRMNLLSGFVLLIITLEIVNAYFDHRLNTWGINPTASKPFPGVFLAPFLHASFSHVIVNAGPFLVLGWLVSLRGAGKFIAISLFIMLLGGMGVWLFGREAYHIGSSGLVFGYFGFLLALGLFERQKKSLFISFVVFALYGGIFIGVIPTEARVSWETHLFGLVAGIVAAWIWSVPEHKKSDPSSKISKVPEDWRL